MTVTPRPFPPARPHDPIRELLPGVFIVTGRMNIGPMTFSRNMIVLQEGERLVLVNTVRLDEAGLASLDKLGQVSDVLRIGAFHGSDDPFYKERYGCTTWAVRGQRYFAGLDPKAGQTYFEPDVWMDAQTALPLPGASLYIVETTPPEAVLRIEAGGGTLISCDSLQNWATSDAHFNLLARLFMWSQGFIKPHNLGPGWIKQHKPDPGQLSGILELGFVNLLPAHGAPVLGDAPEKFRPAIEAYARAAKA